MFVIYRVARVSHILNIPRHSYNTFLILPFTDRMKTNRSDDLELRSFFLNILENIDAFLGNRQVNFDLSFQFISKATTFKIY